MDIDYPSCHSMDQQWFAVDQYGHVAVFSTGEDGHLPQGAGNQYLFDELWGLRQPDGTDYPGREEAVPRCGVFYYTFDWPSDPVRPYGREAAPERPLHVDQLPPHLRKSWKKIRFDTLDFSRSELVQPLEFFPCSFWYSDWLAYLCGDGKTVRPIPGQEGRFVEFCRQMEAEQPDFSRELRFEFRYGDGVAWLCSGGKVVRPFPGQESRFEAFCQEVYRQKPADWARDLRFEMSGQEENPGSPPAGSPTDIGEK